MAGEEHPRKEPVVFKWPGKKPDTRLQVFQETFHVHSTILKLHSAYFRTFMDSVDKTVSSGPWCYEYATVIDPDGTWALESKEKVKELVLDCPPNSFGPAQTFEKYLRALYMERYVIDDVVEFEHLTNLADFYCSLPTLSFSLHSVLWTSEVFKSQIPSNAKEIIILAKKLRHPILFTECVIHLAGDLNNWREVESIHFEDNDITQLVRLKHYEMKDKVGNAMAQLVDVASQFDFALPNMYAVHTVYQSILLKIRECILSQSKTFAMSVTVENWALFFRSLTDLPVGPIKKDKACELACMETFYYNVDQVLKNNLVLDPAGVPGTGFYEKRFLCAGVSDCELPWDITQTDW